MEIVDLEKVDSYISALQGNWNESYGTFEMIQDPEREDCYLLILSTGGWSDNEQAISEFQRNYPMFYACFWSMDARGGYIEFSIPKKHIKEDISSYNLYDAHITSEKKHTNFISKKEIEKILKFWLEDCIDYQYSRANCLDELINKFNLKIDE